MRVTYLGTASVTLDYAGSRLITDPTFDPAGTSYSMAPAWLPAAWFTSTKGYSSPPLPRGPFDAALISHDQHHDNLDRSGRAFVMSDAVATVVTHPAGARRLGRERAGVVGVRPGEQLAVGSGIRLTGLPARHGPHLTPQVNQVTGFLLEAPGEPTVWITGDTVMTPRIRAAAAARKGRVDVLVVHGGGVRFPRAPLGIGRARFTFTPDQVVELCEALDPRVVIPVHRSGWTHFQPEAELRATLDGSRFGERVRWLEPGESSGIEA